MKPPHSLYKRIETGDAVIIICPVSDEGDISDFLSESDMGYLERMKFRPRRNSSASWRAAVRRELGDVEFGYNEVGAPVILGKDRGDCIGVSHTSDLVAVIISGRRCAIDIENTNRNFDRAAARYISGEEATLPAADAPLFKAALWCAKETLYKFSGRTGLDLRDDTKVTAIEFEAGTLTGAIRQEDGNWDEYPMYMLSAGDALVVYMTGE